MNMLAVTDAVRFTHILAVSIGLGAAFMADIVALSRINTRIDDSTIARLETCHKLIWSALIVMWISGTAMIYIRTDFDIAAFSPKLFSKLGTVAVLTTNAVLISTIAMPLLRAARGQSVLRLPLARLLTMAALGAVSTASWLLALAMGVSKVLAKSDWAMFEHVVPVVYLTAILGVTLLMLTLRWTVAPAAEPVKRRPA
jgi:hypothetical protein